MYSCQIFKKFDFKTTKGFQSGRAIAEEIQNRRNQLINNDELLIRLDNEEDKLIQVELQGKLDQQCLRLRKVVSLSSLAVQVISFLYFFVIFGSCFVAAKIGIPLVARKIGEYCLFPLMKRRLFGGACLGVMTAKFKVDNADILQIGSADTDLPRLERLDNKVRDIQKSLENLEESSTTYKLRKRAMDYFSCLIALKKGQDPVEQNRRLSELNNYPSIDDIHPRNMEIIRIIRQLEPIQ